MKLIKPDISLPDISIDGEAEEQRNDLAIAALAVTSVTNAVEQNTAVEAARDIRSYVKRVVAARLSITKPVDAFKARVMEIERDHLDPLRQHQLRLERLVTVFQVGEQRRVEAEEKQRHEAYLLAEAAKLEAQEKARKAAERMATEKGLAVAVAAEQVAVAAEATVQAIIREPLPEVRKASGVATKQVMRWECTDVLALVKARPDLCKIEAKASAILSTCVPNMPDLPPGLRLWYETVTTTRGW